MKIKSLINQLQDIADTEGDVDIAVVDPDDYVLDITDVTWNSDLEAYTIETVNSN